MRQVLIDRDGIPPRGLKPDLSPPADSLRAVYNARIGHRRHLVATKEPGGGHGDLRSDV